MNLLTNNFESGKFSKMGVGTDKGQFGLGYDHKI